MISLNCETHYNKVFPAPIEEEIFKHLHDFITTVIVVGDQREFLSALIIPKPCADRVTIQAGIAKANRKAVNELGMVRKFTLLDPKTKFTESGGEIGPSLKIKRLCISEKYKDVIDEMYQ